jgi:hypothetical protein
MRLGFIPNWCRRLASSEIFRWDGGSVSSVRATSNGISPSVRILCDRVHHAKHSNHDHHLAPDRGVYLKLDPDLYRIIHKKAYTRVYV